VSHFIAHRALRLGLRHEFSMVAGGYDADNAKTRAWLTTRMPGFVEPDDDRRIVLVQTIHALTQATEQASNSLFVAMRDAWFSKKTAVAGDLTWIKEELWHATHEAFYDYVKRLDEATDISSVSMQIRDEFRVVLSKTALARFDFHVQTDVLDPAVLRRAIRARYELAGMLGGHGPSGEKLMATLGLAPPTPPKRRRRRANGDQPEEVSV
jgi:hypothetical protein